jgi:hypothetical protein
VFDAIEAVQWGWAKRIRSHRSLCLMWMRIGLVPVPPPAVDLQRRFVDGNRILTTARAALTHPKCA